MKYNFVTIEGCIGAGKTTLAKALAEGQNGRLILESFEQNPFLPKFYEDPVRHAFPVELYFMAERYQQLKRLLSETDLFVQFTISDYLFQKSLIFANNNLNQDEERLYRMLFDIINPSLPKPDLVIYLYAPVSKLLDNIKKRGRPFEQNISAGYLEQIQQAYLDYFKLLLMPRVILINTQDMNFVSNKYDYDTIIEVLNTDFDTGLHYL